MHSLKQQSKEENKKKSPSSYGYRGVVDIFIKNNIDYKDWVVKELDKQRGGIDFMLPNAQGEIYLTWEDLYCVDVTFVNTKATYKEVVTLPELEVMVGKLEEQRQRTVGVIRDMMKDAFSDK